MRQQIQMKYSMGDVDVDMLDNGWIAVVNYDASVAGEMGWVSASDEGHLLHERGLGLVMRPAVVVVLMLMHAPPLELVPLYSAYSVHRSDDVTT